MLVGGLVIFLVIAFLVSVERRSKGGGSGGGSRDTARRAGQAARSVGRFIRGTPGGDGWGGQRKDPWA